MPSSILDSAISASSLKNRARQYGAEYALRAVRKSAPQWSAKPSRTITSRRRSATAAWGWSTRRWTHAPSQVLPSSSPDPAGAPPPSPPPLPRQTKTPPHHPPSPPLSHFPPPTTPRETPNHPRTHRSSGLSPEDPPPPPQNSVPPLPPPPPRSFPLSPPTHPPPAASPRPPPLLTALWPRVDCQAPRFSGGSACPVALP